jgi:hypothetical protein
MYVRENQERSYFTVMVYLNGDFEGGSTRFLSRDERRYLDVIPQAGRVLVFQHDTYNKNEK